jgi:hypothetical protein
VLIGLNSNRYSQYWVEGRSGRKRIGAWSFGGYKLESTTIPELMKEIDESPFTDAESTDFRMEGDLLVGSVRAEIVRYFGIDREVIVGKKCGSSWEIVQTSQPSRF